MSIQAKAAHFKGCKALYAREFTAAAREFALVDLYRTIGKKADADEVMRHAAEIMSAANAATASAVAA